MIEQRTADWYAQRVGKVTASRIADVVAKTKTGWGASRDNYMADLIAERLTGQTAERYTNAAMQWGTDKEPEAVAAYEFLKDCETSEVGFIQHPTIEMSGASPDRRVSVDGLVEFKCPNTATHIDTILSGSIAGKYILQMQWQMACDNRKWCDYVSFDPRMPANLQLFVKRVDRDNPMIADLEKDVIKFLGELEFKIEELKRKAA
jgi:putative phage-type endonuclease